MTLRVPVVARASRPWSGGDVMHARNMGKMLMPQAESVRISPRPAKLKAVKSVDTLMAEYAFCPCSEVSIMSNHCLVKFPPFFGQWLSKELAA